jgi:hypothetical protein
MLPIVMVLLAQDLGPPGDDATPVRSPLTQQRQRRCLPGEDAEIVVCGGGVDSQRIEPLPAWSDQPVIRPAGARLSPNKTVSVQAQESQSPFASGPRAMISFKLDF